ncbi:MAG: PQQ-like beta-propeller repeat protein [Bryobacterales bacterium]|nr:PQQ-like beta-propeller repeat protein [Bryobacterales bacterium]
MRALILLIAMAWPLCAADWPQWRGPARDGQAEARQQWPDELERGWSIVVGEGHSSPVAEGDSVYVFSREAEAETLRRVAISDGRVVWKTAYPVSYTPMGVAAPHGKGPKSTPVVDDGRVCTLGVTGVLSCHEAADGKLLWRKSFDKAFASTYPLYGAAMSPIVYDGKLIAHVGGDGAGALIAFDIASGAEAWRWAEDGPGYSSPILVRVRGRSELVTQSEQNVIAINPDDGKTLWMMPFTTPYKQNSVTPVPFRDMLVFGGTRQPTFAVRVNADTPVKAWESADVTLYMSTPVRVGERLCGFTEKRKGALYCQDPNTGAVHWMSEGRMGDNALLIAAGDRIVAATSEGEVIVAPSGGAAYAPEHVYKVAESPVWAHPALVDEGLLIKDQTALTLWRMR